MAGGVRDGAPIKAILLGGAAGGFLGPDRLDVRLTFEDARAGGYTLGSGVIMVLRCERRSGRSLPADRAILPRRVLRPVRAVPRRHRSPGGGPASTGRRPHASARRADELALLEDVAAVMRDASICGLGQTAASAVQSAIAHLRPVRPGDGRVSAVPLGMPRTLIDVEIDGRTVRVPEGSTILDACRAEGIDTPTMCYADNLTPINACRVCVVEVEGSRVLVPACSRAAEAGMKISTDTERVRRSRTLVMEFLASSVDTSLASARLAPLAGRVRGAPGAVRRRDGADGGGGARRAGARPPPRPRPGGRRDGRAAGQGRQRALRARLRPVRPLLQVRRGVRHRRPAHVRDRGRGPRVRRPDLDRVRRAAGRQRLRVLRQLHRGVSDRRADVHERARHACRRHVGRGRADRDEHDLPVLRRRVRARAPRPGQRDREGDLAGRQRRDERPSVHQGPVRLPVRATAEDVETVPRRR